MLPGRGFVDCRYPIERVVLHNELLAVLRGGFAGEGGSRVA
jgi:hypothetical protein